MTKREAIALAESHWWEKVTPEEAALFQLTEEKLCMPFSDFQAGMEKLLGRPVFTHEFVNPDALLREWKGEQKRPTLRQIMDLIPADKRIIVTAK